MLSWRYLCVQAPVHTDQRERYPSSRSDHRTHYERSGRILDGLLQVQFLVRSERCFQCTLPHDLASQLYSTYLTVHSYLFSTNILVHVRIRGHTRNRIFLIIYIKCFDSHYLYKISILNFVVFSRRFFHEISIGNFFNGNFKT